MKKKICLIAISALSISFLFGCHKPAKQDISIIYTTDVHCGLSNNLGYSSLVHYKEQLEKKNYVTLVDAGDYLQGDYVGAISNGKYIIDVMNEAKYDVITLGNHEFDYGIDVLSERINEFKGDVVSCNVSYIGKHENKLNKVKPYVIKKYGKKKIGFVGVTTPTTIVESSPKNFSEDGEIAYDFGASTTEHFYSLVQQNIDSCKSDGADYIILLSHLGSVSHYSPYTSQEVIEHTSGCLAFLDGHAHVSLPWTTHKNKNNEDTYLVGAGYKLNNFASFTIKKDGSFAYDFIDSYTDKSPRMDNYIKTIEEKVDALGNEVVANIDVDLSITDENGLRMVRNRETPIGNLVSDAYRIVSGAQIGIVNGGGIRDNLSKGDVTYKQIKAVHPFGNVLMMKKTTGAKILDYLEFTSRSVEHERVKDGKPLGEDGSFSSVSGLKYSVDTSFESNVILDSANGFAGIDGPRRVKDVQVLIDGEYVPIEENKEYIISSHDFLLEQGGGGAYMFMEDETVSSVQRFDYEVVIEYIVDVLKGHLKDKYSSTEGRINIL